MSAALKYISCPVSQLDLFEPIGVQTQVHSFKDIEYLPTSAIQDESPVTFEILASSSSVSHSGSTSVVYIHTYIHTYMHNLFVIAGLVDVSLRQADVDLLSKI